MWEEKVKDVEMDTRKLSKVERRLWRRWRGMGMEEEEMSDNGE